MNTFLSNLTLTAFFASVALAGALVVGQVPPPAIEPRNPPNFMVLPATPSTVVTQGESIRSIAQRERTHQ